MLVLSRKNGEQIIVRSGADVISICVVDIRSDKVRIGIEAPRHVEVNREEVDKAIRKERSDGGS